MFVSKVENGRASLSSDQITALAEKLNVEARWLKKGTGPMTSKDATRDRRTIGERVFSLRRERQLTQTEFARMLGVSRNTISLLERRKIRASQSLINAVIEKTGVSEGWLRTGEEESRAEEIKEWLRSNPGDKEIIREWLSTGA